MSPSALSKSRRAVSGWSLHRRGLRAIYIAGMTAVEARDRSCTVVPYHPLLSIQQAAPVIQSGAACFT